MIPRTGTCLTAGFDTEIFVLHQVRPRLFLCYFPQSTTFRLSTATLLTPPNHPIFYPNADRYFYLFYTLQQTLLALGFCLADGITSCRLVLADGRVKINSGNCSQTCNKFKPLTLRIQMLLCHAQNTEKVTFHARLGHGPSSAAPSTRAEGCLPPHRTPRPAEFLSPPLFCFPLHTTKSLPGQHRGVIRPRQKVIHGVFHRISSCATSLNSGCSQ